VVRRVLLPGSVVDKLEDLRYTRAGGGVAMPPLVPVAEEGLVKAAWR